MSLCQVLHHLQIVIVIIRGASRGTQPITPDKLAAGLGRNCAHHTDTSGVARRPLLLMVRRDFVV
jgi:hypothetical protein